MSSEENDKGERAGVSLKRKLRTNQETSRSIKINLDGPDR